MVMVRDLDEWHKLVRVASEEGVVTEAEAGTTRDGEGEGLEPGGAGFWLRDHDDVVAAGVEGVLDLQDFIEDLSSMPVLVVLDQWCRPPLSRGKCGNEIFAAYGFGFGFGWNNVVFRPAGGTLLSR